MPRKRPPREAWERIKRRVWERDQGSCQYPHGKHPVPLEEAHIDHIRSGKLADNSMKNLRTLCRYHHVLQADSRHRRMIRKALGDELLPSDWCPLVWDEEEGRREE